MDKSTLIKASLIFGGGFLAFLLFKPKEKLGISELSNPKSFDSGNGKIADASPEDMANAEIVITAYTDALRAGEPPAKLTELNNELMKEFAMRCYLEKGGRIIVCNTKGETILSK